jgi:predicted ATP-binding protein involved in virulence
MHLKKLRLINFRRFSGDHTIEFDRNLTVFAANNGAGKTSMLDAIAYALGPFLSQFPKIKGNAPKDIDVSFTREKDQPFALISAELYKEDETCDVSVSTTWDRIKRLNPAAAAIRNVQNKLLEMGYEVKGFTDIHQEAYYLLEKIDTNVIFPIIAYYGTGRILNDVPARRRSFGKEFYRYQAYEDCLTSNVKFGRLFAHFYSHEDQERRDITEQKDFNYRSTLLEAIRKAITLCIPEYELPRTKLAPFRFVLTSKADGKEYDIKLLSDGYKTTISMVMDIAMRMVQANPHLGAEVLQTPGIVLIDEIELHLHPSWQQRILLDLRRTFPNVQFICTTHSPQVLSTVPSECIRTIDENGDIDNSPDTRTYGAESNRVLVELMHVKTRPEHHDQLVKEFIEITDMGDWTSERYHSLRNTLVHDLGLTDPAIIEADIKKNFQQLVLE